MNDTPNRGRPRTITRERLTDTAIAIGLPNVSVLGMAAAMGVSPKALYKHFSGLEELKQMVAEEIFLRWPLPPLSGYGPQDLERYLLGFSVSMWELVEQHTGIAPYMLRRDMVTAAMMEKMQQHQEAMAQVFNLSVPQAHWLLFTLAYYCVAVTDTALPFTPNTGASAARVAALHQETDAEYEQRVRTLYAMGSRALILGALVTLKEMKGDG